MSPPLTRHDLGKISSTNSNQARLGLTQVTPNGNRYKKPLPECWFSRQPGLGIKLEKSLIFNVLVDSTAAPKSWLGVIQLA
ncbi:MAG TPA: hypothetical protein DDZ80_03000 [Cyanobacteria bacterium UBA8803]|nr:hypothetical protein [Cyanobacteria bacterium UBA8803]